MTGAASPGGKYAMLSSAAVFDAELPLPALRVLAALGTYAGPDGYCFPSQETLAARLGVTRFYVNRLIKILEARGYVVSVRRGRPGDGRTAKAYWLQLEPASAPQGSPQDDETDPGGNSETGATEKSSGGPEGAPADVTSQVTLTDAESAADVTSQVTLTDMRGRSQRDISGGQRDLSGHPNVTSQVTLTDHRTSHLRTDARAREGGGAVAPLDARRRATGWTDCSARGNGGADDVGSDPELAAARALRAVYGRDVDSPIAVLMMALAGCAVPGLRWCEVLVAAAKAHVPWSELVDWHRRAGRSRDGLQALRTLEAHILRWTRADGAGGRQLTAMQQRRPIAEKVS
jgi:biotin operon repressor